MIGSCPVEKVKPVMSKTAFRTELTKLINRESMENGSDTPDFILAEYLTDCLDVFDRAMKSREKWYGREPQPIPAHQCPQETSTPAEIPNQDHPYLRPCDL